MPKKLPLIIEAEELNNYLDADDVLIVNLSKPENYVLNHIPGAVCLNYVWGKLTDTPII